MNSFTMRPILYTGTLFIALAACTGVVEAPDEGSDDSTVAVCSSAVYWKETDKASEAMNPGEKCTVCHEKNVKAPLLPVNGTVYPTLHEPDNCNGVASTVDDKGMVDVQVIITDRTQRTLPAIPVNSVGNFIRTGDPILAPFWVKVVSKGKENKMVMQAPHGDCNVCHTQMGDQGAPGRVHVPQ